MATAGSGRGVVIVGRLLARRHRMKLTTNAPKDLPVPLVCNPAP